MIGPMNDPPDSGTVRVTTNGTTRELPADEPVFLLRGQDVFAADAVRAWARMALRGGADPETVARALEHADRMDAWPVKKIPDAPGRSLHGGGAP